MASRQDALPADGLAHDDRSELRRVAPLVLVPDRPQARAEALLVPRERAHGGGWYGRAALGLAYYSQRLGRSDRPMLQARRIRRKLGSEDGTDEPDKPKGMHWSTYNRLLDQADELDDLGWIRVLGLSPP